MGRFVIMSTLNPQLYTLLDENFSNEDEKIFLNNFKCYLDFDQDNDFVINLNNIVTYLGFARKNNLKTLLNKYFYENEHYKLLSPLNFDDEDDYSKQHGGHNKETILLTPNAFKELCLHAQTEKAKKIRLYYIKMENLVFKFLTKELTDSKIKIKGLENELKKYTEKINKKNFSFGETVYIVKDCNLFNIYKVGSSINMNSREQSYNCHSVSSKIIYTIKCKNQKLLEDVNAFSVCRISISK